MTVKSQRCQPPASARKLNAAPVLCMRTRLKKGVTSRPSPAVKARLTQALVARSAATIAPLNTSQRTHAQALGLGMPPRFARTFEVRYTAPANCPLARIDADVRAGG